MGDDTSLPSSFHLRDLTNLYDETVSTQPNHLRMDTKLFSKLALICQILLSTCQLSEDQTVVVKETENICESWNRGTQQDSYLACGVTTEFDTSLGKWTWQFDSGQAPNILCMDQEQLEEEEQELVSMANVPIP